MLIIRKLRSDALLFIIPVFFVWGCGAAARTKMKTDSTKPPVDRIEVVREATPFVLVQLDGFLEEFPDDKELLVTAAEFHSGWAWAFFEDTDKPRAIKLYKKARDYALRALKQNEAFKRSLNQTHEDFVRALKTFDKEDVPALYFAANSWFSWIGLSHSSNTAVLVDVPKVLAMMDRILELDAEFDYGGTHALLGSWLASRPIMLGGQPEEAKYHFEEAFEISESKYLLWQLLYAKFYAVQIQDRELFVTTLEKIISAPENLFPEKNFVNVIARRKAKLLLAKVDDFF